MRLVALLSFLLAADVAHAAPRSRVHQVQRQIKYRTLQARAAVVDVAGKAAGVIELTGIRFPVTKYRKRVTAGLVRGSRLDDEGVRKLKQDGYGGLVALTLETNRDQPVARAVGLPYQHIPILDNASPSVAQVKQFLDFVAENGKNGSGVYVHCEAGKGRTGVMVAAYRMAFEGWSGAQALVEAKTFGLRMPNQRRFIRQLYRELKAGRVDGYPRGDATAQFAFAD